MKYLAMLMVFLTLQVMFVSTSFAEVRGRQDACNLKYYSLSAGESVSLVPSKPVTLDSQSSQFEFGLLPEQGSQPEQDSPVQLRLNLSGIGTDWSSAGSESAVCSIFIDGVYDQDIVVWSGNKPETYSVALEIPHPAGTHCVRPRSRTGRMQCAPTKIALKFSPEKSCRGARGIEISAASVSIAKHSSDLERAVVAYAPILLGRQMLTNNHNDTPLALYYQISRNENGTTEISYGYVFSNEDGGDATHPARQQARWGRLSDIQHVFTTTVDEKYKCLSEQFHGANHVIRPFHGEHLGTHPIIRTCTENNLVTDESGPFALRFRMLPEIELLTSTPMGELMRNHPSWSVISAKELQRERKVMSDAEWTSIPEEQWKKFLLADKIPDLRRYIYVQYLAEIHELSAVAIRVTLNSGHEYTSDFNAPNTALERNGWFQTAVLVPPNTEESEIKEVSFVVRSLSGKQAKGAVTRFGHIFTLADDYTPVELKTATRP